MPSFNLTQSRCKTSRLARWLAAWRSATATRRRGLQNPRVDQQGPHLAVEPRNNRGADYEFFGRLRDADGIEETSGEEADRRLAEWAA